MKLKMIAVISALGLVLLGILVWWLNSGPMLRQVDYAQLPGWNHADLDKSILAFQKSCRAFIKQNPERIVGTDHIILKVKDWQPACRAALNISSSNPALARNFFERWFIPVEFYDKKPIKGLFTGYYMPLLRGSYNQSAEFNVPIYETPRDLITVDLNLFFPHSKYRKIVGRLSGNKLIPYYTRKEINEGAINQTAHVLVWIHSPIDRLFLEIQGSGVIELDDGTKMFIGYDSQNGARYTAIAGVLIKKGVMTKDNASMQGIKHYLEKHPEQLDSVINQNKSFIFFRKLASTGALGSQGVTLTPGYSLAIDRQWIPMGAPLWLSTTRPDSKNPDASKPMQRLMIAQDTGGAIKGKVRGDVFWGGGDKATQIAGHMKNEGHYWLLLPRQTFLRLQKHLINL